MNGTALRKPTARRVVGMVAGIVIIALGIALFKQKTAYEIGVRLVGSEMCIRDSTGVHPRYLSVYPQPVKPCVSPPVCL